MLNFLKFSLKFLLLFLTVVVFFALSTLWYFSWMNYKDYQITNPQYPSRVYSEDRKLIAEYALEKRLFIPFKSIPDKVTLFFQLRIKIFLNILELMQEEF